MNSQRNAFKWTGMAVLLAVFISFAILLPSVFAQGENPPTPTSEVTPEPFEVPELEQENGVQSLMSPQSSGDWSASVNLSNTAGESVKPKIAADNVGNLHMIWRETVSGGKQEIFYSWTDGVTQSVPVNVSNSPSLNSDSSQLVVDSTGTARIVWQEEDTTHADDYEIHYSSCNETGCTSPTILSNGQACSAYAGDWKGIDPQIGIDANDNLMVVWMSYEPNPKIYIMYSRWSASGSPPSNRTGCHVSSGFYYYPSLTGDAVGNFHLVMMNSNYNVFYSKYAGGSWSAVQNIGSGAIPVVYADPNNKIHAAWWVTNAPPQYRSKEENSTTWSTVENIFSSTQCSDLSLITDVDNLPRLVCSAGAVYEASRQTSGWTETIIIPSMASQPDIAKDASGSLHLVWSDSSLGNWEISYSANLALGCIPDTFEPDNTSATGSPIVIGEVQRHTLCPQNDEDWTNLQVSTTRSVNGNLLVETFDLEPNSILSNSNTKLLVLDEALGQIGVNLDRGFGPFPGSPDILQSSRVVWHPAIGGVFNINIVPETPINEQENSGYSLRLTNPLTWVDPVDQGSYAPTKVNAPFVTRDDNTIYFTQMFTYEQAELDALNAMPATLAWEFRRPAVDIKTGVEVDGSNVDYGDYWQSVNGICAGEYWTNLPNHSDKFVEESNWQSLPGCTPNNPSPTVPKNEEFELYVDNPTELIAGKVYYITIKFHIHNAYLNSNYQFYVSKVEYCELWGTLDVICNLRELDWAEKHTANLIEGHLQPAP